MNLRMVTDDNNQIAQFVVINIADHILSELSKALLSQINSAIWTIRHGASGVNMYHAVCTSSKGGIRHSLVSKDKYGKSSE